MHLRSFGDLVHTAFGRAVLIKIIVLIGLVGLGALNRQRSLPRLRAAVASGATPGAVGRVLRTTLRVEVGLVVVVLGVTAALVSYAATVGALRRPLLQERADRVRWRSS